MLKALADRLAEAFAEWLHRKVRRELWGYAPDESLDVTALVREEYRGIRPAPGYPACPDHAVKAPLFTLLGAEGVGMSLTESFAMLPTAAVSGFYLGHPDAHYFAGGASARTHFATRANRPRGCATELRPTARWGHEFSNMVRRDGGFLRRCPWRRWKFASRMRTAKSSTAATFPRRSVPRTIHRSNARLRMQETATGSP
jgi:hypothetical protein